MEKKSSSAPGFMLYKEKGLLVQELNNEQAGKVFKAVFTYAETGEIIELEQAERMVFLAMKSDIDRSAEQYRKIQEKNRQNAKEGWEKRRQK